MKTLWLVIGGGIAVVWLWAVAMMMLRPLVFWALDVGGAFFASGVMLSGVAIALGAISSVIYLFVRRRRESPTNAR